MALILVAFVVFAQAPANQKAEIKTPQAKCPPCKQIIERMAPQYADGLIKVTVNVQRGTTQVEWDPARTNIQAIRKAIAACGFDADNEPAENEVKSRLPDCCRH